MSESDLLQFEATINNLRRQVSGIESTASVFERLAPWIKTLVISAFAIGIWVATIEIRQQHAITQAQRTGKIAEDLSHWRERIDATVVSSADVVSLDKRLARTEDHLETVIRQLEKIDRALADQTGGRRYSSPAPTSTGK